MRATSKILAVCLTLLMLISVLPAGALAADVSDSFMIEAGSVTGKVGEEVRVPINITQNPGIVGLRVKVTYDADKLELKDAVAENVFQNVQASEKFSDHPYVMVFDSATATENVTYLGTLATLTFVIKEGAAGDNNINLTVDQVKDYDTKSVAAYAQAGKVTVEEPAPSTPFTVTVGGKTMELVAKGKQSFEGGSECETYEVTVPAGTTSLTVSSANKMYFYTPSQSGLGMGTSKTFDITGDVVYKINVYSVDWYYLSVKVEQGQTPDGPTVPTVDNQTGATPTAAVTFSEDGTTMNVKNDAACVVLVKSGDTYTKLTATPNAAGGYDFDVSTLPEGASIVVAVKGDATGDGSMDVSDVLACMYAFTGSGDALTNLQTMVADTDGNGTVDVTDVLALMYAFTGTSFAW